jgi:hypothetical protein
MFLAKVQEELRHDPVAAEPPKDPQPRETVPLRPRRLCQVFHDPWAPDQPRGNAPRRQALQVPV